MSSFSRRSVLRGVIGSAGVGVALPLLDCFLDTNGKAFAETGQRIPVRFGTWIWGCGFIPQKWIPSAVGRDYLMPADLSPLEPYRDKLALFSGFDVKLDGVANKPHITGCLGLRTGIPVPNENVKAPTLDVLIANKIGGNTRFRSLELSACGLKNSYSYHAAGSPNPSETSPAALYRRIFGDGFQDPNSLTFKPETRIMARRSVLSAISDDRQKLLRTVGASDRQRLDEYFTSIRQIEKQLDLQLQPPAPRREFYGPRGAHRCRPGLRIEPGHGHASYHGWSAGQGAAGQPDPSVQYAVFRYHLELAP